MLLLFLVASCNLEDFELDKFAGPVDLEPSFQLPIASGGYTVWDLITSGDTDPEMIYTDEEGVVHFKKSENNIYELKTAELIDFPSTIVLDPIQKDIQINSLVGETNSLNLSVSSVLPIQGKSISLHTSQEIQIDPAVTIYDLELKSGNLSIDLDYVGVSISKGTTSIVVSNLMDTAGNEVSFSIPTGQTSTSIDISEHHLILGGDAYNEFNLDIEVSIDEGATNSDDDAKIILNTSFTSLDFQTIYGDFGLQQVAIDGADTKFSLDLDFLEDLEGTFSFEDPSIIVSYTNGFSLPISLEAEVGGYFIDGTSSRLSVLEQQVKYPTITDITNGLAPLTDAITIDHSNSNILEFLERIPDDYITMAGAMVVNKGRAVSPENPNVISNDSKVSLGVTFDIPLQLKTDGLVMTDTIDVGSADTDLFKELVLNVDYKNGLQVNLDLYVQFVDTISGNAINNMEILSLGKMNNALVDSDGNTTSGTTGTLSLDLSADNIQNFSEANGIVLRSIIGSLEDDFSTISASDSLDISLSISAKVDGSEL